MSVSSSRVELVCASQQSIFLAGESGPVWRVVEGIVRIDRQNGTLRQPVQLALPGDLIGTEALCAQAYQFSAVAFTPCKLEAVRPEPKATAAGLLQQALLQQMTRSLDMAQLRSGSVVQRLGHLLSLMPRAENAHQPSLPALREVPCSWTPKPKPCAVSWVNSCPVGADPCPPKAPWLGQKPPSSATFGRPTMRPWA